MRLVVSGAVAEILMLDFLALALVDLVAPQGGVKFSLINFSIFFNLGRRIL